MSDSEQTTIQPRVARFQRGLAILFTIYALLLFTSTHIRLPPQTLPGQSDKLAHFLAYAGLTCLLACWLSAKQLAFPKIVVISISFGLLFGMFDELLQIPVGRNCDLNDWFADAVGTLIGISIFSGLRYCSPASWWKSSVQQPAEKIPYDT